MMGRMFHLYSIGERETKCVLDGMKRKETLL